MSDHKTPFRRSLRLLSNLFLLTVSALLLGLGNPPVPRYQIMDLGTLGGSASAAWGLNDLGQVVGWSDLADDSRHAFLYSDGAMQDLGTLPGGTHSYATSINDFGTVAGYSGVNEFGPSFPEIFQGFVWKQGSMQSLGALYCPCSFNDRYGTSSGYSVNNWGWVAGASETVRGSWVQHAMLWRDNQLQDLGGGAGDWSISRIFAANDAGQLVGDFSQDAGRLNSFDRHASLWQRGTRSDLGTLPGYTSSTALAANWEGMVAGWSGSSDGSASHAFVWRKGVMSDLGTLAGDANSAALGINAAGQVVGWSGTAEDAGSHAFLWRAGQMLDLNQTIPPGSGWVLTTARAINLRSQIAGTGLHNGQVRAYLLTLPEHGSRRK